MRKRSFGRQMGRNTGSRKALRRSLIRSLVEVGSIKTTLTKAKFIKPEIDKIMAKVGEGSPHAKRLVLARLGNDEKTTNLLFGKYKDLTKKRSSGFTRITKLPKRRGDNTEMARLEWIDKPEEKKETKKTTKKK